MREILDRHAKRLTPAERRAIWETVSGSRAAGSRSRLRWALAVTGATAAVAWFTVAVVQREPAAPRDPRSAGSVEAPSEVRGLAPRSERAEPLAGIRRAPIGGQGAPRAESATQGERGVGAPAPSASGARAPIVRLTGAVTGRITDSQDRPVPYANVTVKEARAGALSAEDGTYRIDRLPPATYSLQVQALGHEKQVREGIRVGGDETATADIRLTELPVRSMETIRVMAGGSIEPKVIATKRNASAERLREPPVDNLRSAAGGDAIVVVPGSALHVRGGRHGEIRGQVNGVNVGPPPPPVIPTTGGTRLPNDEAYDSMFFRNYGVNPFIATDEDPRSTFAVDVDAASYTVTRRYLELGHLPPADAVRVEEFVNFFPQGYPRFESEDFRILIDGAPAPFGRGYHLLRIGLKGREVVERDRKPAQLTFVIDVSGSMGRENRLELVKRALRLLLDRLRDDDRIGIVVYGSEGRVLLEPVALGDPAARATRVRPRSNDREEEALGEWRTGRRRVQEAIDLLRPEGSTNAEQGLRLGYDMARRGYRPEAINRIVLCSDGVANVGLTGPESILDRVRTEADRGVHLSAIGFGMGNYNDVLMEQLADRGDGNYYYVDDLDEARRVFVEHLTGTLQTVAKDAKVQVEFDSTRVLRYRLLGFENRDVADRDFRNDKVDAGEVGAGHEVTALYEVKLAPQVTRGTIATVRLRYARPETDGGGTPEVREIERRFSAAELGRRFEDASPHFRLDAAVAEFAEILRGSYWAREGRLSDVLSVARRAAGSLRDDTTAEFVSLVEKAARLSARPKPGPRGEER